MTTRKPPELDDLPTEVRNALDALREVPTEHTHQEATIDAAHERMRPKFLAMMSRMLADEDDEAPGKTGAG